MSPFQLDSLLDEVADRRGEGRPEVRRDRQAQDFGRVRLDQTREALAAFGGDREELRARLRRILRAGSPSAALQLAGCVPDRWRQIGDSARAAVAPTRIARINTCLVILDTLLEHTLVLGEPLSVEGLVFEKNSPSTPETRPVCASEKSTGNDRSQWPFGTSTEVVGLLRAQKKRPPRLARWPHETPVASTSYICGRPPVPRLISLISRHTRVMRAS